MQSWRRKVHDFGERTEAKGKEAGKAARDGLEAAWARTEVEGRKLRGATAEGWQEAKLSFERASRELSDAWNRTGADDK